MDTIYEQWDEILNYMKREYNLSDVSFNTWIKPLKIHSVDEKNHILTIIVPPQKLALSYISNKYTEPLAVTIAEITGVIFDVKFVLEKDIPAEQTDKSLAQALALKKEAANLNPKYTFNTFVVGKNNTFAHAAALAVAESPGEIYNPLYLYGGVGLGKTHLMHSIGHFILEKNINARVLYISSETFTNELIEAIRNSNNTAMTKFREKYRNIDVLLIDDIQFIMGKESTQEEFFHTFNELQSNNKAIIISSDRPPKDLDILEDRIKSRFEWGLLADISSPDYETRVAILRKKEEMDGYYLDDEILEYIAQNIKSNIRELEGSLNRIIAFARLNNQAVTMELAESVLKDIITPNEKKVLTPDYIINIVAEHFETTPAELEGSKRNSKIVYPRQIAMYLCRELCNLPLKAIGSYMGNRDHTTIMHGCEKIEDYLETDEKTRNNIEILKKKLL